MFIRVYPFVSYFQPHHPSTVLGSTERLRKARGKAKTMTSKMPSTPWDTKVFIRSVASTLCNTMPRRLRGKLKPSDETDETVQILSILIITNLPGVFFSGLRRPNMKLWSTVFVETLVKNHQFRGKVGWCLSDDLSSNVILWDAYS